MRTRELRDPTDRELRKDAYERSLLRTAGCSYPSEPPPPVGSVGRMGPTEWLGSTLAESMHGRHYDTHGAIALRAEHATSAETHAALVRTSCAAGLCVCLPEPAAAAWPASVEALLARGRRRARL